MSNRLLQQLDIVYPIIQAPMAGVSTPELAAWARWDWAPLRFLRRGR